MIDQKNRKGWGAPVTAIVVAALSFLPLGAWLGGHPDSEFALELIEWMAGSAIAIGSGLVLAIASRDWVWLWPKVDTQKLETWIIRHWRMMVGSIALLAAALYTACALLVFKTRPALIDEMVQIIQARIFASGHLWAPSLYHPAFFSSLHMVDMDGRTFSQFPPGGPAFITLGVLLGASWIVGPLFGALTIVIFATVARIAEPNRTTAALATLLLAVAPFVMFMSGSHMNHVTTGFCLMMAVAGLAIVTQEDCKVGQPGASLRATPHLHNYKQHNSQQRLTAAFLSGLGLGLAATIRPVDALAFALPAGLWYVVRTVRDYSRWREMIASGIGVVIPVALMLYFNKQTTGSPLLFGYEVLWGKGHDLGFHRSPMGAAHTPALGLAYINDYFIALQRYLFETPIPGLVPAIGALWLTRRLKPLDRYLIASSVILLACYFAYWHPGYFMGPRFVYPLIPVIALWTARFPALWRDAMRTADGLKPANTVSVLVYRTGVYTLLVSALIAVGYEIPIRAIGHATHLSPEQTDRPHSPQDRRVRHALVFVRESWESQLVTRMWALGVSHVQAERLYHDVDACRLDHALAAEEAHLDAGHIDTTRTPVMNDLEPLVKDSNLVVPMSLGLNGTIRVQRGSVYTSDCVARVRETAAGVLPLTPFAMLQGDSNIYARDLHARDTILTKENPDRKVYLLRPESPDSTALPHFYPLNLDSARKDWKE